MLAAAPRTPPPLDAEDEPHEAENRPVVAVGGRGNANVPASVKRVNFAAACADPSTLLETTTTTTGTEAREDIDIKFPAYVQDAPYLVWVFQSPSTRSLFASFFALCTGAVTTKRLNKTWLKSHANASLEEWRNDIGSVLLRTSGADETPRRPPARAPPAGPLESSSFVSASAAAGAAISSSSSCNLTGLLDESSTDSTGSGAQNPQAAELDSLKVLVATQRAQLVSLTQEVEELRAAKRGKFHADGSADDGEGAEARATLEMMRRDLNDAHARRVESEKRADAKTREAECVLAECEEMMEAATRQQREWLDESAKLKAELAKKQALVEELTAYVSTLLAAASSSSKKP